MRRLYYSSLDQQHGFEPSPSDPLHLMLLMMDLRAFVERRGDASTVG